MFNFVIVALSLPDRATYMFITIISNTGGIHASFFESKASSLKDDIALVMEAYAKDIEQDAHDHGYSNVVMTAVPLDAEKMEGFIYQRGLQVRLFDTLPAYDKNGYIVPSDWIEKSGFKLVDFMLFEPSKS